MMDEKVAANGGGNFRKNFETWVLQSLEEFRGPKNHKNESSDLYLPDFSNVNSSIFHIARI